MSVKIDGMSLSALRDLNKRVEAALVQAKARELEEARREIEAMAAAKGFKVGELFGAKDSILSSKLFRDKKSGVTWGGRGRYPRGFDRSRAERIGA